MPWQIGEVAVCLKSGTMVKETAVVWQADAGQCFLQALIWEPTSSGQHGIANDLSLADVGR